MFQSLKRSRYVKRLRHRKEEVVCAAALALVEMGESNTVELLIEILEDPTCPRIGAVQAMGRLKDPRAVEPLIKALGDGEADVRVETARALAVLGQSEWQQFVMGDPNDWTRLGNSTDPRAVEPLIKALSDQNPPVRECAVRALARVKDPRVVEPLISLLADQDSFVRVLAADALGQLKDPRAVEPLISALQEHMINATPNQESAVRASAAKALGQLKDPRAVGPLISALGNQESVVRASAAEALGQMKDPRAVDPLVKILRGGGPADMRRLAAEALGQMKDPRAVDPLIMALGDDKDWELRIAAAKALGRLKDPRAVDSLIVVLGDGRNGAVRGAAAEALGQLKNPRAVEPLIKALAKELADDHGLIDHRNRIYFEVLGQLKDPRAVEPLISALTSVVWGSDMYVSCAEALRQCADQSIVEPMIFDLKDPSWRVRMKACRVLAALQDQRAVEPVFAVLADESSSAILVPAAEVLVSLVPARAIEPLIGIWDRLRSDTAKRAVLCLLAPLRPPSAFDMFVEGLSICEAQCAKALGDIGDARAVEPLIEALGINSRYIPNAVGGAFAAAALGELGDARAIDPLVEALKSRPVPVRREAAKSLTKLASACSAEVRKHWKTIGIRVNSPHTDRSETYEERVSYDYSDCHEDHIDRGGGVPGYTWPDEPPAENQPVPSVQEGAPPSPSGTFVVTCPSCGKRFQAPTDAVGKRARCKKCGESFEIPPPPDPPAELDF